jgi:hypothetical protein
VVSSERAYLTRAPPSMSHRDDSLRVDGREMNGAPAKIDLHLRCVDCERSVDGSTAVIGISRRDRETICEQTTVKSRSAELEIDGIHSGSRAFLASTGGASITNHRESTSPSLREPHLELD